MHGLWSVPVQLPDYNGVGMIVWTALVLIALLIPTCGCIWRQLAEQSWPATRTIVAGMLCCILWFSLHLINLIVHFKQLKTTYAYAIAGVIFYVPRACSDVLITWGVFRLGARFSQDSPWNGSLPKLIEIWLGSLLWFLVLTRLMLLFTLSLCWLAAADLRTTNALAKGYYGFDAAYTAVQFVAVGMSFFVVLDLAEIASKPIHYDTKNSSVCSWFARQTVPALLVRSFCEVVIAGQLSRTAVNFPYIMRARDVVYGLFSIPLFWTLLFNMPSEKALVDTWREEAEDDTRRELAHLITQRSCNGKSTVPHINALLDELKPAPDLGSVNGASGPPLQINKATTKKKTQARFKQYYLDVLRKHYAGWTPIQRWQGEAAGPQR